MGSHADYRGSYRKIDAKDAWQRMLIHVQEHAFSKPTQGLSVSMVCAFEQILIESRLRDEVRMRSLLRDPAFFENEDSTWRAFDCGEAMGDDDRCRTPGRVVVGVFSVN